MPLPQPTLRIDPILYLPIASCNLAISMRCGCFKLQIPPSATTPKSICVICPTFSSMLIFAINESIAASLHFCANIEVVAKAKTVKKKSTLLFILHNFNSI